MWTDTERAEAVRRLEQRELASLQQVLASGPDSMQRRIATARINELQQRHQTPPGNTNHG